MSPTFKTDRFSESVQPGLNDSIKCKGNLSKAYVIGEGDFVLFM